MNANNRPNLLPNPGRNLTMINPLPEVENLFRSFLVPGKQPPTQDHTNLSDQTDLLSVNDHRESPPAVRIK